MNVSFPSRVVMTKTLRTMEHVILGVHKRQFSIGIGIIGIGILIRGCSVCTIIYLLIYLIRPAAFASSIPISVPVLLLCSHCRHHLQLLHGDTGRCNKRKRAQISNWRHYVPSPLWAHSH